MITRIRLIVLFCFSAAVTSHAQQSVQDTEQVYESRRQKIKLYYDSLTAAGVDVAPALVAVRTTSAVQVAAAVDLNLGFENITNGFTGWSGELSYEIGGGRRTKAAIDESGIVTYTGDPIFPAGVQSKDFSGNDQPARHKIFRDKTETDPYGGFPIVPSFAGNAVVRLGNPTVGASPQGIYNYALLEREALTYTFTVPSDGPYLVINYATVLADPSYGGSNGHIGDNKTFFRVDVLAPDNSIVTCAAYEVYTNNVVESKIPGFQTSAVYPWVKFKPWTATVVDVSAFTGQTITLKFSGGDCLAGGHWGYSYVDAYATSRALIAMSNGVEVGSICQGQPVDFSSLYTGRYTDEVYDWDFGDGTVSHERSPTKVYTATGTRVVSLKVNGTCMLSRTFIVTPGASAAFTVDDPKPVPGRAVPITLTGYQSGTSNTINWGDNSADGPPGAAASHTYTISGTYTITVSSTRAGSSCSDVRQRTIRVMALCETVLPKVSSANGTFLMDKVTGNIVHSRNQCPVQAVVPCVSAQASAYSKVVRASAVILSDAWPYAGVYADQSGVPFPASANAFERGERGKWRTKAVYAYNTSLTPEDKNYKAGTFALQNFNWKNEANNNTTKWLLSSETTAYSPHGDAISERNILGVESTAKFGYNNAMPYLTAKNAGYGSVLFESFEMIYNDMLEDKMAKPSVGIQDDIRKPFGENYAHSGYHSWHLMAGGNLDVGQFRLMATQLTKGLQVKVWVRVANPGTYDAMLNNTSTPFKVKIVGQSTTPVPFKVIARTGDWILCEAVVSGFGTVQAETPFTLTLQYLVNEAVWIDDIRVQPVDSEMACYVYDKVNLRLLAVFDDQHFGLYYQYNGEGKLVRKKRETERGVKTIQETQYNTTLK